MKKNEQSLTKGGVEEYKVLDKVYNANWTDDIPEGTNVINFNFKNLFEDPSDDFKTSDEQGIQEISFKTKERIRNFRGHGQRTLELYEIISNRKVA